MVVISHKWMLSFFLTLIIMIILPVAIIARDNSDVLRILLFSGRNNHDWEKTTPVLKQIFENSGRFVVDVTNDPSTYDELSFVDYDVIVSNWCAWPEVTGARWGAKTEKAFLDFVRKGKGFVLFHAASATHQDWPEFQQLIGATWKLDVTGHGRIHTFKVQNNDNNHPVTKGMKDFWIKDELWHRMATQPGINVLCNALSEKENGGSGKIEPVVICTELQKGRCFYNILGHNVETMQNSGWQTLMLRGTEWAATGKVTIPFPANWPSDAGQGMDTEPNQ